MREHIAPAVYYLEVHLLFASVVCLAAWVLTSLWKGSAGCKYWIWVATSLNFVVPVGGFFDRFGASHVPWATQLRGLDAMGVEISQSLAIATLLLGVWLGGAALMLARLLLRMRAIRRESGRAAGQSLLAHGIPVRFAGSGLAPSVDGVLRPHISLPRGIERLLSRHELDAVLLHELTHARRRDNLVGLIHEVALCGLWFHPLVWLTGSRLATFRELSCDDSVIANSCGAHLVSALAKLADPGESHLLRAGAASLLRQRLTRLTASMPRGASLIADASLIAVFAAVLLACVVATIAHTPSCFNVRM